MLNNYYHRQTTFINTKYALQLLLGQLVSFAVIFLAHVVGSLKVVISGGFEPERSQEDDLRVK